MNLANIEIKEMTMTQPQQISSGMMAISDGEFSALRDLIHQRFGINLTEQKRSLLVGRLQKLMRTRGFSAFQQYIDFLCLLFESIHERSTDIIEKSERLGVFFRWV